MGAPSPATQVLPNAPLVAYTISLPMAEDKKGTSTMDAIEESGGNNATERNNKGKLEGKFFGGWRGSWKGSWKLSWG